MSDQPNSPLKTAITHVQELAQKMDGDTKQTLEQITRLLEDAAKSGEGQTAQDVIRENAVFISHMIHELRKPMTSIRGYADMLFKGLIPDLEMQKQFLGTIRNNVISMEQLVSDISDYSKMTSGRIQAEKKMDMAKNILLAVEKATKEKAEEHKHELVFDIPQGLPILNSDSVRIIQAIVKLVDNAIKYTPEGGKITITASPAEGGLEVRVKDNGVGLHPEELARLGELYFRGDDPLVTNSKGYGFGIPIAMECMKMVGGRLFFESEKGVGSTFGIFLPAMS